MQNDAIPRISKLLKIENVSAALNDQMCMFQFNWQSKIPCYWYLYNRSYLLAGR